MISPLYKCLKWRTLQGIKAEYGALHKRCTVVKRIEQNTGLLNFPSKRIKAGCTGDDGAQTMWHFLHADSFNSSTVEIMQVAFHQNIPGSVSFQ